MADILARFQLVDEISDKLSAMAESGQQMVAQFERFEQTVNAAFAGLDRAASSGVRTIDGLANSMNRIQGASDSVSGSSSSLADSLNRSGDAAADAASQADSLSDAASRCGQDLTDATQHTDELSQAGQDASRALAEQAAALARCEQASGELSQATERANQTETSLAEAMQRASQAAEELAENGRVSAETQEELAAASEAASQAMDELTAAQQEAEAAMAEYNQLLTSGTADLDQLTQASERVSNATTRLEEANRRASDATDELSDTTRRAGEEAENAGDQGSSAAEQLSNALTAAGITELVTEIAGAFMEASQAAAEFETATMKISTIADTSKVPLAQMSSDIMALSRETGEGVSDLSEAVYSALSASVDTASAVEFTETATKLAAGGFTDSATAVDVLTTSLNAYKLEATEAESIADMLITTQNLGKTTVNELAASVGAVIPLASAYGVKMDNLSAAYAELTKGGIATAEAGTYLKSMLSELGDSGSDVADVLISRTGSSFSQLMAQGYSLGDVLNELGASVDGDAGAFNELWSSSEAGIGALSIYNAGAAQFNTTLGAMQTSIGATSSAYATMTDTTAHAQQELSNAANNLKVSIGQNINPLVEKLYTLGAKGLNMLSDLTQQFPLATKVLSAFAIGLGVVVTGIVGVTTVTKVAIPAIKAFGLAASTALKGPVGWIAIGLTAAVAAGAAFVAMLEDANAETAGMTATTRQQYYELQDLQAEYDEMCASGNGLSEEASQLRNEIEDLTTSFEANRQTLESFTAEVDKLCQSAAEVSNTFHSFMHDIDEQERGIFALVQRYADLSSKSELAAGQEEQLEAITQQLADRYPDLAAGLDDATLSATDYAEALKLACQQEAEAQREAQVADSYTQLMEKQAALQAERAKAQAEYDAELLAHNMQYDADTGSYTNGLYDADSLLASWFTDLDDYKAALDEIDATQAQIAADIAEIENSWADAAQAALDAAESPSSYQEAVSVAYEGVRIDIENLCAAYDEAYNSALASFGGQFGLFDQAQADMDATVASAQAALDSQLAYWESYGANVEVLKNTSAADLGITQENYNAIMVYARDGSTQAAGFAASMVSAIQSGNEQAVANLANTAGSVAAKQAEIASTTADWVTDFSAQMDQLTNKMNETVQGMNLSDEAANSATQTINSYTQALQAGGGRAVSAAKSIAAQISAALSSAKTSVNVRVASSGVSTVQADANGTTNAASVFLAGERGPELVARPAAAYANGTMNSTDFFIAGEKGPELIVGEQGSTVFPTEETDRLIRALSGMDSPHTAARVNSVTNNYNTTTLADHASGMDNFSDTLIVDMSRLIGYALTQMQETFEQTQPEPNIADVPEVNLQPLAIQAEPPVFQPEPLLIQTEPQATEDLANPLEESRWNRLLTARHDREVSLPPLSENPKTRDSTNQTESTKRIYLEIAGHGSLALNGRNYDPDELAEWMADNLRPVLIRTLKQEIFEEGTGTRAY